MATDLCEAVPSPNVSQVTSAVNGAAAHPLSLLPLPPLDTNSRYVDLTSPDPNNSTPYVYVKIPFSVYAKILKHVEYMKYKEPDRNVIKGAWTKEEDDKLLNLVHLMGAKNWNQISQHLPGRQGKQCRERYINHLDPIICKDKWTTEEDRAILEGYRRFGPQWSRIARFLPRPRTANAVKNHWNSSLKKGAGEGDGITTQPATGPPSAAPARTQHPAHSPIPGFPSAMMLAGLLPPRFGGLPGLPPLPFPPTFPLPPDFRGFPFPFPFPFPPLGNQGDAPALGPDANAQLPAEQQAIAEQAIAEQQAIVADATAAAMALQQQQATQPDDIREKSPEDPLAVAADESDDDDDDDEEDEDDDDEDEDDEQNNSTAGAGPKLAGDTVKVEPQPVPMALPDYAAVAQAAAIASQQLLARAGNPAGLPNLDFLPIFGLFAQPPGPPPAQTTLAEAEPSESAEAPAAKRVKLEPESIPLPQE
eukprot:TRINITY_DN6257_c0_g1_i1.p1 TRINITY_DN6257_c0_g1~~TRINITY_DN6257_c0_g1_i1.p1  ORF type:complete len:476 (-),score=80.45 TRINITY_DN6257_c0_g1_i1:53-1480(-)